MHATFWKTRNFRFSVWLSALVWLYSGCAAFAALEWKQDAVTLDAKVSDTILSGTFQVENTGTASIQILKVSPSCSCLTATASTTTVDPGKSAEIDFRFDLEGKVGEQKKKILVRTDDGAPPKPLAVNINLPEWIKLTTEGVTWFKGEPREMKTVDVALMPGMDVKGISVHSSSDVLKAELQVVADDPECGYRVMLTPAPGDMPAKVKVRIDVELKSGVTKKAMFVASLP